MSTKLTLALVEDNAIMRYMLESYLNDHFIVSEFNNGLSFFEWMEETGPPDVIVTDIKMPEMDGFELINLLKKSKLYQDIPVIMLSGLSDSNARIKSLQLGAEDYLTKPFNPAELLLKVQKILKKNHKHVNENFNTTLYQSK